MCRNRLAKALSQPLPEGTVRVDAGVQSVNFDEHGALRLILSCYMCCRGCQGSLRSGRAIKRQRGHGLVVGRQAFGATKWVVSCLVHVLGPST